MRLFLDNTLIHRVGHVLDSSDLDRIRAIDAVAVFRLAEHILFAEDTIVSCFEPNYSFERSAEILDRFTRLGTVGVGPNSINVQWTPFSRREYRQACQRAGFSVLAELASLTTSDLGALGKIADDAVMPQETPPTELETWLGDPEFLSVSPEREQELLLPGAAGSLELTILKCRPLFQTLRRLIMRSSRPKRASNIAAVSAMIRVHINEELALMRSAIYDPAPQRARISKAAQSIFRYQIERQIQAHAGRSRELSKTISRNHGLDVLFRLETTDVLPLPLFLWHVFRGKRLGSPQAILAAAQELRDHSDVKEIRKWLSKWESRTSSDRNCENRTPEEQAKILVDGAIESRCQTENWLIRFLRSISFRADGKWIPADTIAWVIGDLQSRRTAERALKSMVGEVSRRNQMVKQIVGQFGRDISGMSAPPPYRELWHRVKGRKHLR